MTPEYVQMLRGALANIKEASNGEVVMDIQGIADAALASPIPPAPLRPMSEAPVNAQLLEALKLCAGVVAGETLHKSALIQALTKAQAAIQAAEAQG